MVEYLLTKYSLKRGTCFRNSISTCVSMMTTTIEGKMESHTLALRMCAWKWHMSPNPHWPKQVTYQSNLQGVEKSHFTMCPSLWVLYNEGNVEFPLLLSCVAVNPAVRSTQSFPALVQKGLLIWRSPFSLLSLILEDHSALRQERFCKLLPTQHITRAVPLYRRGGIIPRHPQVRLQSSKSNSISSNTHSSWRWANQTSKMEPRAPREDTIIVCCVLKIRLHTERP